jgi:hypothetical protein
MGIAVILQFLICTAALRVVHNGRPGRQGLR